MAIDLAIALGGLLGGFTVGLTGMGGGALLTPMLVLVFGVPPMAAVSSDLVVSLLMKPVGGVVHLREGTVDRGLVRWLCLGSIPAAFAGVLLLQAIGSEHVDGFLRRALGIALLAIAGAILLRSRFGGRAQDDGPIQVRPGLTALIGAIGGVIVGMTSVGSGSVIIVLLLLAYPTLSSARLVGTDLVQAIPLVGAAALGHAIFGEVRMDLTASLLLGGIPGMYVGARLSSRGFERIVRPTLFTVLVASGLKLAQVV